MAVVFSFKKNFLVRFLKPLFSLLLLLFCFFYLFIFVSLFSFFFSFVSKLFLLCLFFVFNLFTFLFFFDFYDVFFFYTSWLDAPSNFLSREFLHFFKLIFVFIFDVFSFCKFVLLSVLNLKNFIGIFFVFFQFLNELVYEAIFQFLTDTEDHVMISELNWMPRYIFGDMLERTLRFNKLLNLFSFSDVFYEKSFVYKRVGVVNSRFWLFRHITFVKKTDHRFRRILGNFVEPDRWLLDFRDFRFSDYFDPWRFFSDEGIFRNSKDVFISLDARKNTNYISIKLLHNYYSVMETKRERPAERVYPDYYVSSSFVYESTLIFFVYAYLFVTLEPHLQLELLEIEADDPELIDKGEVDLKINPYLEYWNISDAVESTFFSMYPVDLHEYTDDDDLSWDFLLAQPHTLQYHNVSDLEEFETYKEQNSLFDEFRSFSLAYPLYRLALKMSAYRLVDFLMFTDSGRCFKILFKALLYLPIGFCILFFKFILFFCDWFLWLPFFLRFLLFVLLFFSCLIFLF